MDPYAQLLMGNALLGPQTNSDCQSKSLSMGLIKLPPNLLQLPNRVRGGVREAYGGANRVALPPWQALSDLPVGRLREP